MQPEQIKHLELIQAVVSRMASNSFLLKGWSVTLSAALVGLAAGKDANLKFAVLAVFAPLLFWGLDEYYLRQERLFRKLYDHIRVMADADWQANGRFDMSTHIFHNDAGSWCKTARKPVVYGVHLLVIVIVTAILAFVVLQ
jgi:hypothetical protein